MLVVSKQHWKLGEGGHYDTVEERVVDAFPHDVGPFFFVCFPGPVA